MEQFEVAVFRLFQECRDGLMWHVDAAGRFRFSANIPDLFWWGGGDDEPITPDDLPLLERTHADLAALDCADMWLAELYAARRRKMRPQGASYHNPGVGTWLRHPEMAEQYVALNAFYDQCGPEREVGFGNPRPRPDDSRIETADEARAAIARQLEQIGVTWPALKAMAPTFPPGQFQVVYYLVTQYGYLLDPERYEPTDDERASAVKSTLRDYMRCTWAEAADMAETGEWRTKAQRVNWPFIADLGALVTWE